jgi:hypothetical protein
MCMLRANGECILAKYMKMISESVQGHIVVMKAIHPDKAGRVVAASKFRTSDNHFYTLRFSK